MDEGLRFKGSRGLGLVFRACGFKGFYKGSIRVLYGIL